MQKSNGALSSRTNYKIKDCIKIKIRRCNIFFCFFLQPKKMAFSSTTRKHIFNFMLGLCFCSSNAPGCGELYDIVIPVNGYFKCQIKVVPPPHPGNNGSPDSELLSQPKHV
ncbi:hypothetical protein ATANTOWER_030243 [Ataeniobius toweri]|uniref:Uncharacterized protein n=1 Tax=Ataeniobius toweri TaxID=208326 RepID=A0ABU7ARW6_9TELE|nr:hypothetical protein [Ataeniobius toweri]